MNIGAALSWRQSYNPLRGLTIARLVQILEQAEQGYYADAQWLYRFIEKRDATLKAVKSRRLAAIKKLDWDIKKANPSDEKKASKFSKLADEQAAFLREKYEAIDNISTAVEWLAIADFRGFSHLEKHFKGGDIIHLEPVPQWFWARKRPSPQWLYNSNATQAIKGIPIDEGDFVIRENDDPINELASVCFVYKQLGQKDWVSFVETYGIPPLFVELPNGQGTTGTEWQTLAESIIGNGRGVLPNGASIKTVDAGKGMAPFEDHIRYLDEQIVMAATGGVLTALNQATGLGSGQSESHRDAFLDIAKGSAKGISECFQRQIDKGLIENEFGKDKPVLAYFELAYNEVDSRETVVRDSATLSSAGYEMDLAQLSEKTGYKLAKKPDQAGVGMGGPFGGQGQQAPVGETEEVLEEGEERPVTIEELQALLDESQNQDDESFFNSVGGILKRFEKTEKRA